MSLRHAALLSSTLLAVGGGANAADLLAAEPAVVAAPAKPDLIFEVGAGALVSPAYEGSDEYIIAPYPIVSVSYLNIPGLLEVGGGPSNGFSLGPSFRYIDKRNAGDYPALTGLDSVDATYELGLRASYSWLFAEVYGEARYAFGGADGFTGALGANAISHPFETLELKLGPKATFASDDYMATYFGVDGAEAARSGFSEFDAKGGFKSVGLEATARYEFHPNWFLNANAEYERLVGDAADSPIVDVGSKDQFFFGLGLSRQFAVDLF